MQEEKMWTPPLTRLHTISPTLMILKICMLSYVQWML
ncbi:hypothetical protein Goarm_006188 [Gossypium armourianum]|uniref:Uncharacterized protein n=2 Tax=Gossypium TaxID=3633 RepID=A0A7J9JH81_9ROSI|nr:hypothetical protein [Gossypium armourianum]